MSGRKTSLIHTESSSRGHLEGGDGDVHSLDCGEGSVRWGTHVYTYRTGPGMRAQVCALGTVHVHGLCVRARVHEWCV